MDTWQTVAISAGLAWASGLRVYFVLFAVGLAGRFGYVVLPERLTLLSHDWVLVASGAMLLAEFVADKVPLFDSLWDSVHTFIRIPAGAVLAAAAIGIEHPAVTLAAAIVGGTLASGTHIAKAGSRVVINSSPEPVSNWSASFTEDGLAAGGLWLALAHPAVFLILLGLFVAFLIWLLPRLWRATRVVRGGRASFFGSVLQK
jgi:Domain of unknown function (DUF4126)